MKKLALFILLMACVVSFSGSAFGSNGDQPPAPPKAMMEPHAPGN